MAKKNPNNDVPVIEIDCVTQRFPGVVALDDVSLAISAGETHAIVGENGAGKSTLMKILAGINCDYQGELRIAGCAVRFASTRDAEAAGVSIIHQELNLVDELSVAANIFLGRELRAGWGFLDDRAMHDKAGELLRTLGCEIPPDTPVARLRVGDQQLVEIAKALLLENRILIMDEPTSALTGVETERLFRVIADLKQQGVTILYISHKMEEVFQLADRITVLRDGQWIATVAPAETNVTAVTHLMVGREIDAEAFAAGRAIGEEVLRVENLRLAVAGSVKRWRLADISFTLHAGEILGIAGLLGAGRTELLEVLFGMAEGETEGTISLCGRNVKFSHPREALQAGMALVAEDRKRLGLFENVDVGANITLSSLEKLTAGGFVSSRAEQHAAEESIAQLGIRTSGPGAAITELSGGNQQKCIIARWLRTQPKVLLLDDPTRGIDVGAKAEIYRLADGLCRQGMGIIVTSSELPELLTLCDRILVLSDGRLTGTFSRDEATEQNLMEAATR
ncbi:Xylose import ATP-binding protein XylG [Symmachiella dynata]|uniref:sugar ABC transporter ATP-binding protein n=1 Tax=Symmachiella dynata TaxID=2527995 RepID=UPI00118A57D1|nr:sugar ABC transporter ATP-binding protein [Symmachiella dynata]QDT47751.1 Xylose import ATP-binding protein XylG [Symmachiella dynata]